MSHNLPLVHLLPGAFLCPTPEHGASPSPPSPPTHRPTPVFTCVHRHMHECRVSPVSRSSTSCSARPCSPPAPSARSARPRDSSEPVRVCRHECDDWAESHLCASVKWEEREGRPTLPGPGTPAGLCAAGGRQELSVAPGPAHARRLRLILYLTGASPAPGTQPPSVAAPRCATHASRTTLHPPLHPPAALRSFSSAMSRPCTWWGLGGRG